MNFFGWLRVWPKPKEKPPANLGTVDPLHWHDFLHFLNESVPKLAAGAADTVAADAQVPFCSWVDDPGLVGLMKERLLRQGIWLEYVRGSDQTEPWASVVFYFRGDIDWFQRREAIRAEIRSSLLQGEVP